MLRAMKMIILSTHSMPQPGATDHSSQHVSTFYRLQLGSSKEEERLRCVGSFAKGGWKLWCSGWEQAVGFEEWAISVAS